MKEFRGVYFLFLYQIISNEKTNEEIFFQELKIYRSDPNTLRNELQQYWVPFIDDKMLNQTITLDNGSDELTSLMLYLDNKINLKFDNLRLDSNLSKIAKNQAIFMSEQEKLSYYQNLLGLDDRMKNKGKYKGQIVEIVFKFSNEISRITNVFLNLLLETENSNKINREIFNQQKFSYMGVGFQKKKNFIWGSLILAEKFICISECSVNQKNKQFKLQLQKCNSIHKEANFSKSSTKKCFKKKKPSSTSFILLSNEDENVVPEENPFEEQENNQNIMNIENLELLEERSENNPRGLKKETFNLLIKKKIKKSTKSCVFCMEHFYQKEVIRILPCKHYFHNKCLKPWFKTKVICPTCRFDIESYLEDQLIKPLLQFKNVVRQIEN